jgi:DNA-binding NtrC family response regulator
VLPIALVAVELGMRWGLDAGAFAYLTKPVDIPRFLETVERAARLREPVR